MPSTSSPDTTTTIKTDIEASISPTVVTKPASKCRRFGIVLLAAVALVAGAVLITIFSMRAIYPDLDGTPTTPETSSQFNVFINVYGRTSYDTNPSVVVCQPPCENYTLLTVLNAIDDEESTLTPPNASDISLARLTRLDNGSFIEETVILGAEASDYLEAHEDHAEDVDERTDAGRKLGFFGSDDRRGVGGDEAKRAPFRSVVRLTSDIGSCSGTLVDDNTVLTAAHCVYRQGKYHLPEVEVHPWLEERSFGNPGTWFKSAHSDCKVRAFIYYPCNVRWCRKWGWFPYICHIETCRRFASPAKDCTWRYESSSAVVPNGWKSTACQASTGSSCYQSDFQDDIALVKLRAMQGKHAGARDGMLTAKHTNSYSMPLTVTGYPGDRRPFLMTHTDRVHSRDRNYLKHKIDINSGQSGSGMQHGNDVYGVAVSSGSSYNGGRRIDSWWLNVLQSHY